MSSSEENVLPWLRKVENDLLNIENNLAAGVPTNRITAIIKEGRGITGDTAVRLATFFNTSAEFWMNLQKTYELRLAEKAMPSRIIKRIQQQREALV